MQRTWGKNPTEIWKIQP